MNVFGNVPNYEKYNFLNDVLFKGLQSFYAKRVQYYWAKEFSRQLLKNEKYQDLNKVIHVSILGDNYFKDARSWHKIVLLDAETYEPFSDAQEYYFLETKKAPKSGLEDWICLFQNKISEISSEAIAKLYEEAVNLMSNNMTRAEYDAEEKRILRENSMAYEAEYRAKEGERIGMERGMKKGMEEGIEKGREQVKRISRMYLSKHPIEEIAKKVEMPVDEVEATLRGLGFLD